MIAATVVTGAVLVATGLTGFVSADAARTNAVDAVAAIEDVEAPAVSSVAQATSDPDTAAQAKVSGETTVSVPLDATAGLKLDAPGAAADMTIGLPFADQADPAAESQTPGVVVYDNNNGSSTVPVIHQDGTVQIITVIENRYSPSRYDYPIALPGGANLSLNDNGSVRVATADESYAVEIAAPWAKDANGNSVSTRYQLDGNMLTQVVEFTPNTAFPVVADPSVITTTYTYSRTDVERMWNTYQAMGRICNLVPGLSYMASLLCPGGARLQDALSTAHYQKKRVKAAFYNCGFTYCNYYEYKVVS